MARPVRDGVGGRLLLPATKNGATCRARQGTISRKSKKINIKQRRSTQVNAGQRKSKRKTNAKKPKEKHFASVKRYSLSCAHSKGAYPYPTEVLGRPRKRRGLQGRGFSACLCPKTILVELGRGAARYYGLMGSDSMPLGSGKGGERVCLFRLKPRQSPLESPTILGGRLG